MRSVGFNSPVWARSRNCVEVIGPCFSAPLAWNHSCDIASSPDLRVEVSATDCLRLVKREWDRIRLTKSPERTCRRIIEPIELRLPLPKIEGDDRVQEKALDTEEIAMTVVLNLSDEPP